jgi:hypothetical protein
MTQDKKEAKYGRIIARVNSKSRPEVFYEVRLLGDKLSCNCKGWIFNREQPKRCSHTDAAGMIYLQRPNGRKENLEKRAGVNRSDDAVVTIVKTLLDVGGYAPAQPGALIRMAGVLRPYLRLRELEVTPDPVEKAIRANDLLQQAPRCITLED